MSEVQCDIRSLFITKHLWAARSFSKWDSETLIFCTRHGQSGFVKVRNSVHLQLMLVEKWRSVWPGGWRTTTLSFLLSCSHVLPRLVLLKEAKYLHWHGRSPGCMSMIIAHANLLQHGPVTSCTKLCIGEPTNELEREIKRWIGEIMLKKTWPGKQTWTYTHLKRHRTCTEHGAS